MPHRRCSYENANLRLSPAPRWDQLKDAQKKMTESKQDKRKENLAKPRGDSKVHRDLVYTCRSFCLSVHLSMCPSIHPSIH